MNTNDITDPKKAREYVQYFVNNYPMPKGKIDRIYTTSGRVIIFSEMTDEDAVDAANMLFRDIEKPATKNITRQ